MIRLCLALLLSLASSTFASTYIPQDPLRIPGFVDFYNNEYDQAYAYFKKELLAHPNDADDYNHLAQVILYRELFRDGALESELVTGSNPFLHSPKLNMPSQMRAEFKNCIHKSLQLNNTALERNANDLHALYSLGVAHGLSGNYAFLIEKAWTDALREAATANKLNKQVLALDPQYVDARLVVGLYEYVVGSLPFYVRMLGFIEGFHGDKEEGLQQIRDVSQHGVLNKYDAEILLAVLYRREHHPELALPLLKKAATQLPGNYLLKLEQVQMYSDLGDKNSALNVLAEVDELRCEKVPGYETLTAQKVEYLRGNLLFWYNDPTAALHDLISATRDTSDLDMNTSLLAWLRLGQTYDLCKDHSTAVKAYKNAIAIAPDSEIANEAERYISNAYRRKQKRG